MLDPEVCTIVPSVLRSRSNQCFDIRAALGYVAGGDLLLGVEL